MKSGLLFSALSLGLALLAGGVAAKTSPAAGEQVLECNFVGGVEDWITNRLYIARDLKTNEIKVLDGVVHQMYKKPFPVNVIQDTSSRLEIDWTIKNAPGVRSSASVIFHVTLLKADMKVLEKAVVSGFDNKESRSGTCAIYTK